LKQSLLNLTVRWV